VADPREGKISPNMVKLLEGIGMQLAPAIQRVKAREELQ
jgi:hypothetical protein